MSTKKARSYEKNFEVAAPVESVWKAITEGDELTRWFCQEARCEPDIGGQQHIDWGGGAKATGVITVWKPNAHLRTEAVRPDLDNSMSAGKSEPYATDWYLEHQGGVTRVRMVASGFGEGPDWDHEYDGTFHGWDMFHTTMKHYLSRHLRFCCLSRARAARLCASSGKSRSTSRCQARASSKRPNCSLSPASRWYSSVRGSSPSVLIANASS
jgi:uncharacterized protein YndB with AHSA1/START domain